MEELKDIFYEGLLGNNKKTLLQVFITEMAEERNINGSTKARSCQSFISIFSCHINAHIIGPSSYTISVDVVI